MAEYRHSFIYASPPECPLSVENRTDDWFSLEGPAMGIQMLHGAKTETEIARELSIYICKPRRARLRRNSGQSLAFFQRAEQERTASLARAGHLSVPQVRPGSTGRPRVGSAPGDVSGLTLEIHRIGLCHLAK